MPRSAPFRLALLALAAAGAAGCSPYVQGNGVYREENRTPSQAFQGVHVEDGVQARITSGAAQASVVVSGDENFISHLKVEVVQEPTNGPVLYVRIDVDNWSSTNWPTARIEIPQLRYGYAEGDASQLTAVSVATQGLKLEAHAQGSVTVSGAGGGTVDVVASGASVNAQGYPVGAGATVDLASGARAWLNSAGPVTGTVRAGCTLDNRVAAGSCAGLTLEGGPTILCNP